MKGYAFALLVPALFCTDFVQDQSETTGRASPEAAPGKAIETLAGNEVIAQYCVRCHGDRIQKAGLSLASFDATAPEQNTEIAEKMIHKLRAGMMPPPGALRPEDADLSALAISLETRLDELATADPNPGSRPFQRLNRAEYEAAVLDLLDLEVRAGDYLPPDTKSANFDNIADVQMLSATLLDAYLTAAAEISRLAVGDPNASPSSRTYTNPGYVTQWDRVDGAPRGTRGGISVVHNFLADGEYVLKLAFEHTTTGGFFGQTTQGEQLEISVNGVRTHLLEVDRWMHVSDPNGMNMVTEPIFIRAGPQRITAAFLRKSEGPVEDLLSRHEWSLNDRQIGVGGYGVTCLAHLKDLVIDGPYNATGVSETPSRRKIFTRRPTSEEEEEPVAREIITRLGSRAYRRPLTDSDRSALMSFYTDAAAVGGFELGIKSALQTIVASPDFVFRFEEPPDDIKPDENYRIRETDLATRLSFFLWGTPPDEDLLVLAEENRLSGSLDQQVRRMLADPRSRALATRFAAQWLRLDDLDRVHPDRLLYPDFHQQLADAMRRETELLFDHLVRAERSVFELLTADYTFVNERLAEHYGIPDIAGDEFRRVQHSDSNRHGLLGQGSILTLTSHANRTSPVLRGKWVMEVLLGSPPPPPPPNVPDFDETKPAESGRLLSVRERMEIHRANPTCNSCHRMIDPIGVALENFDLTGRWRIRDNGTPVDAVSEHYDGSELKGPGDLRDALLRRPESFVRNFVENLMAYAIGRRIEFKDMPAVRKIARSAAADDYGMTSIILGVVNSDAFQMSRAPVSGDDKK